MVAHGVLADLQDYRQAGLLGGGDQRFGVLELDDVERADTPAVGNCLAEHLVESGEGHSASQARQAAPREPARTPSAARSSRGGCRKVIRLAISVRSGSSSAAPLSARPPPIRTRSTPV